METLFNLLDGTPTYPEQLAYFIGLLCFFFGLGCGMAKPRKPRK